MSKTGFEPMTCGLEVRCSVQLSYLDNIVGKTGLEPATPWSQTKYSNQLNYFPIRAENGDRTRNPQLGRLMLYQLSYFRS